MLALSYVLGFLSYHLYEKHFLRAGRRYFEPREPIVT
jgi:peptidoglycan/LPS O-acetylase OafA/YrhL